MITRFLFLMIIAYSLNNVSSKCSNGQDPETYCAIMFCQNVDNCKQGFNLILRDISNCICCNYCEADISKSKKYIYFQNFKKNKTGLT